MSRNQYDAIVVGARCAGSPTAMLLARQGHRVLVVDRARFPSDTVSTHLLDPPRVAALARWGLLERLVASGCPPMTPTPSTSARSRSRDLQGPRRPPSPTPPADRA
jgi:2-polyprenyl-6-methoxyphenol hydroxylase-like FAD-dependent oxidoreductase